MEVLHWLDGVHRVDSIYYVERLLSSCQLVRKMEITCIEAERGLPSWSTEIRAAGLIYEIPEPHEAAKVDSR